MIFGDHGAEGGIPGIRISDCDFAKRRDQVLSLVDRPATEPLIVGNVLTTLVTMVAVESVPGHNAEPFRNADREGGEGRRSKGQWAERGSGLPPSN